ncbi:diguanylate cyclase [Pyruvatibacter mobilis]|nr:diguanylate cyclase [Pyruvatibacter mobilis]
MSRMTGATQNGNERTMSKSATGTASTGNVTPLRIADAARLTRHVFVRDLRLDAHIGVYRHEEGRTQPILINVDLTVTEGDVEIGDNIDNVVCYRSVVTNIKALVDEGHVRLVETLAERIASDCLEDPRVLAARVRVEKLEAIEEAHSVGIEIERLRPLPAS